MAESLESLERQGLVTRRNGDRVRALHGTRAQPSKMAAMDDKSKVDNKIPRKGPDASDRDSIDKNQREGSQIASKPTKGGGVGGSKRSPTKNAINEDQKPTFPAGGNVKKRKAWMSHRTAKIRPSGPMYGGPNGRP